MIKNFMELLRQKWFENKFLCIGLDTDHNKIPELIRVNNKYDEAICLFNQRIIDATLDIVCAYKLNMAFYTKLGMLGVQALNETICYLREQAPNTPVILDGKRGDIGNTNFEYAAELFDYFRADAATVSPYLGGETFKPFLDKKDKGIIVLCLTSNPGAQEFQYRQIVCGSKELYELIDKFTLSNIIVAKHIQQELGWERITGEGDSEERFLIPFYQYVAIRVARHWNRNNNCLLVTGAPHSGDIKKLRLLVPHMPFLIPGVGAQQKDVSLENQIRLVIEAAQNKNGECFIINTSRSTIFASDGTDFAESARSEAWKLHQLINKFRKVG